MKILLRWGLIVWIALAGVLVGWVAISRFMLPNDTLVFVTSSRSGETQIAFDLHHGLVQPVATYDSFSYLSNAEDRIAIRDSQRGQTTFDIVDVASGERYQLGQYELGRQIQAIWWESGDESLLVLSSNSGSQLHQIDIQTGDITLALDFADSFITSSIYKPTQNVIAVFSTADNFAQVGDVHVYYIDDGSVDILETVRRFWRWNSDDSQMLYLKVNEPAFNNNLHIYDVASQSSQLVDIDYHGSFLSYIFTPDDSAILYSQGNPAATYIYTLETGEQSQVFDEALVFFNTSPDGRFMTAYNVNVTASTISYYVYDVGAEAFTLLSVTDDNRIGFPTAIVWSPNSEDILFLYDRSQNGLWLEVYTAETSELRYRRQVPIEGIIPQSSGVAPILSWYSDK